MNNKNKVRFGLKNAYYAKVTFNDEGVPQYATPKRLPGAVSLSISPEGELEKFYADDIVYYILNNNSGYKGNLELALIPEDFLTDILHEDKDANGVMVESSDSESERFALLFEFTGDAKAIRHVLYCCTATRPSMEGQTKEQNKQVKTETLEVTADPLPSGQVKAKTCSTTSEAVYNGWYNQVYIPPVAQAAKLSALTVGSLTLSPAFDADVTEYTASTTNATNNITASGETGTTVEIKVNGSAHTSGEAASWTAGENTVTITVSKEGCTSTTYTVTVTKGE